MPPRPRKRFGQHFLHDPAVIAKIVRAIAPRPDDLMVEIGPGHGALTGLLLETLRHLTVIELDADLARKLGASSGAGRRLTVHSSDALAFDFSSLASGPATLRVVGNLPYNISTPLLFHLLAHRAAISDMHLMLQKEVAKRMTATPGNKDYGRLTVMLAAWARLEACFDVGPGAFFPPPRVWSTMVRIKPQAEPRFPIPDLPAFSRLVAHAFSMRRKTLARALRGWLSREQIASLGVDPGARAETLRPEDFARLAALLPAGR